MRTSLLIVPCLLVRTDGPSGDRLCDFPFVLSSSRASTGLSLTRGPAAIGRGSQYHAAGFPYLWNEQWAIIPLQKNGFPCSNGGKPWAVACRSKTGGRHFLGGPWGPAKHWSESRRSAARSNMSSLCSCGIG